MAWVSIAAHARAEVYSLAAQIRVSVAAETVVVYEDRTGLLEFQLVP
ncbi:MAG: hypothetical protein O3B43_06840 [Chloroflexi bacterium]|nr:hypothetical protein [Chloroflexota bacterium]